MRKLLFLFTSFVLIMTLNIKSVYAIKLNKNETVIRLDSSETLQVTGASSNDIRWASTNESIALVYDGVVTGVGIGTTYITVTDSTGSDVCKVTVTGSYIEVTGISLPKSGDTVNVGATKKINATVTPANATNKTITYTSLDSKIATVDSSGTVTGISTGSTYISLTAGNKSALYKIDVVNTVTVKLSSISLPKTRELTEGNSDKLTITYSPNNATNKAVTWKSSNTSIVTVDTNGNIKAVAPGTATITATSKDGNRTATCKITVNALDKTLKGISFDKTELTMSVGKTEQITVSYNPNNANNKNITWRSTNSNVVSVENGVITALKPGKAAIKATSEEGRFQASCKVVVLSDPIESLSFKNEINEVYIDDTVELEIAPVPENTMINDPVWTSSNEEVAIFDEFDMLVAIGLGTTTITVSDKDKKIIATTTVNVVERPDSELIIEIEGYDIKFNQDIKTYDISIEDEEELEISVNRHPDRYVIGGNHDLKNGSVITITVYGDEKVTYMINIRKKKKTSPAIFIIVISLLLIANIIRILIKNKKK